MKSGVWIVVVAIVLLLGIGMGINIARNKPILSNPFAEKTVGEKMRDSADEFMKNFQ